MYKFNSNPILLFFGNTLILPYLIQYKTAHAFSRILRISEWTLGYSNCILKLVFFGNQNRKNHQIHWLLYWISTNYYWCTYYVCTLYSFGVVVKWRPNEKCCMHFFESQTYYLLLLIESNTFSFFIGNILDWISLERGSNL